MSEQTEIVKRIERLVVHVEEAMRLSKRPEEPYQRLALLLFDSAAELILYRETDYRLHWEELLVDRQLESLKAHEQRIGTLPPDLATRKSELEQRATPQKRRERIASDFLPKVAFLEEKGMIPGATLRVLRKLHQYRNGAYHRDEIRSTTLATAVRIYGYLVCVMMRDIPPHTVGWGSEDDYPTVAKYFDGRRPPIGAEVQALIAEQLIMRYAADPQSEVTAALSSHLVDRLDDLDYSLDFIAEFLAERHNDTGWDRDAVLHLLQLPDVLASEYAAAEQVRGINVKVRQRELDAWRARATKLASETDLIVAFGKFADLEDAFEPTEESAHDLARDIDVHINMEIDRMRGK